MADDLRQQARDRFDRVMRVPDSIALMTCLFGLAMPLLFLLGGLLDGRGIRLSNSDMMLYITIKIGVLGVYALCCLFRVVAALIISAQAVRRQHRASYRRDAGRPEDRPDALAQTVRLPVAGRWTSAAASLGR